MAGNISLSDPSVGHSLADDCETDGNFAVICSFFHKFSESLGITYNIQHLKDMIEDNDHLSEELVELHIKLLRKRRKYINKDKWERALVKFCAEYSNVDAWELERYGYKNSKLSIKLKILKRLLEAQFDYNSKFKLEVNANDSQSLRLAPIGRDLNGHMYWYQLDPEFNFRVYREEADDEQSWLLVCQNKSQLESLITDLEANNTIESLNKEETSSMSDTNDSNSNLNNKLVSNDIKFKSDLNSCEDKAKDVKVSQKVCNKTSVENNVSNLLTKTEIKCEPNETIKSEEAISDEKSLSLNLQPKQELIDDKCLENGLIDSNECPKHESTDLSSVLVNIKDTNLLKSASNVNTSDENDKQNDIKSIFNENNSEFNCFVNNNESKDQMKSDFCLNNNNNNKYLFDSQLDCDVLHVIEEIVDKVSSNSVQSKRANSGQSSTTGCHVMTQMTLLSIEQTVSVLCDFLVDEVCKQESVSHARPCAVVRGRGRPYRARGRGRGRGRTTVSVAKVNIYNKSRRSDSVEVEDNEDVMESQPLKRCSRRIQALQERKAQEMSERVKQEQQKIEELAKKRSALIAAKDEEVSEEVSEESSDESSGEGKKKSKKGKLIQKKGCLNTSSSSDDSDSDASEDKKHKKKRRRKGRKNGAKPWEDTDDSSDKSDESVEEEEEHEEEEDVLKFDDNEDEFACEDPDPDAEPVVVRRARTVRKVRSDSSDTNESSSESEVENDDKPCGRCGKYDHPEWILLCDKCDEGFHTSCLRPPLMLIPDGDWFCPPCEHKMLCERLHEELTTLSVQLVKKEREELRKQRLKYVAISVDNILKKPTTGRRDNTNGKEFNDDLLDNECDDKLIDENEDKLRTKEDRDEDMDDEEEDEEESDADDEIGKALWSEDEEEDKYAAIKSRRNRSRKNINYKFSEYDQMIKSAIEMEMDVEYEYEEEESAPELASKSKGKDMSNIIASNAGEELDFSLTPTINTIDSNYDQILAVDESDGTRIEDRPIDSVPNIEKLLENIENKEEEREEKEEMEDENEEESDESETKSETKVGSKKRSAKQSAAARKRHRGLNDLSDTTEGDDDSDEDFKGENSSATEVDDASDEEFVDDGSTQEEEDVSDLSEYNYRRRRSARTTSRSKGRSKGGSKGGQSKKKGYRRDAFVVSSDDSGGSYHPSRGRKGRAAARKKVSYCEDTTDEESEEDYYSQPKSKSKNKFDSSDEEWGQRKDSKAEKQKKLWSDDEEEEEEEDEDNEDNDESNDEEKEEVPKSGSKPGPKSSKTSTVDKIVMKGKPRLSKARGLANLKDEDSNDDESEPTVQKSTKSNKKSKRISDSEEEEELVTNKTTLEKPVVVNSVNTTDQSMPGTNDNGIEMSGQLCDRSEGTVKTVDAIIEQTVVNKQRTDNNLGVGAMTQVHPTLGPLKEQLSSTPVVPSVPQLIPHTNSYPQTTVEMKQNNNIEEYYSLTPLDAYPVSRPPPLKPMAVNDPYLQASSPPRILTLESNSGYPRHPGMEYPPVQHPMQGPKGLMDPRLERPYLSHNMPPNVVPMNTPFGAHPPPLRPNDLRQTHTRPPGPHGFGVPYYPSAPQTGGHPYYPRGNMPSHHEIPTPFPTTHIRPQTNSPIGTVPRTPGPLTTGPMPLPPNYRPSTASPHWNQTVPNRTPIPGYNFGAHPSQTTPSYYGQPHGQSLVAHPHSPHGVPLPPSHYPPAPYQNYGYFGPNASLATPNGAFMIQNLLQQRPPNPEDSSHQMATPVATSASSTTGAPIANTSTTNSTAPSGQPLRATNETFSTY